MIKAIFFDIDGTLVSFKNYRVVKEAKRKGDQNFCCYRTGKGWFRYFR